MIRVITARRLQLLEAQLASLRQERGQLSHLLERERSAKELATQARDFFKADCAEWKGRASRLMDQIGVTSGIIVGPAVSEPAAPPPNPMRQVMRALATQELPKRQADAASAAPQILGVDDQAAREAIAEAINAP